ncbi:MAG: hypothetical protein AAGA29_12100 [Planctomycetota bacterium]
MQRILSLLLLLTLAAAIPAFAQDGQARRAVPADGVAPPPPADAALLLESVEVIPGGNGTVAMRLQPAAEAVDEAPPVAPDDGDATTADGGEESAETPAADELPEGTMRFHLMDGSILTGTLAIDALPVDTEFGRLVVPIDSILSFAPGLNAHPVLAQRIDTLIEQLASPNAAQRDVAQAELISFGPGLIDELLQHAEDPDDERKLRIAAVLEAFYDMQSDPMAFDDAGDEKGPSLTRLDQVVTDGFTIAGAIAIPTFEIQSKFGMLTVNLGDIESAGIVTTAIPEVRRTVEVTATDMTRVAEKNTGIRLNRGDRVVIRAEGQITMSPWGNNAIATPDGCGQCGNYAGNIMMGSLLGRVGDSGSDILVGSNHTFTADRSGTFYLSFALQPNWGRQQFPGKFTVRIRVIPAQ